MGPVNPGLASGLTVLPSLGTMANGSPSASLRHHTARGTAIRVTRSSCNPWWAPPHRRADSWATT